MLKTLLGPLRPAAPLARAWYLHTQDRYGIGHGQRHDSRKRTRSAEDKIREYSSSESMHASQKRRGDLREFRPFLSWSLWAQQRIEGFVGCLISGSMPLPYKVSMTNRSGTSQMEIETAFISLLDATLPTCCQDTWATWRGRLTGMTPQLQNLLRVVTLHRQHTMFQLCENVSQTHVASRALPANHKSGCFDTPHSISQCFAYAPGLTCE
jgi:hypothetical protein